MLHELLFRFSAEMQLQNAFSQSLKNQMSGILHVDYAISQSTFLFHSVTDSVLFSIFQHTQMSVRNLRQDMKISVWCNCCINVRDQSQLALNVTFVFFIESWIIQTLQLKLSSSLFLDWLAWFYQSSVCMLCWHECHLQSVTQTLLYEHLHHKLFINITSAKTQIFLKNKAWKNQIVRMTDITVKVSVRIDDWEMICWTFWILNFLKAFAASYCFCLDQSLQSCCRSLGYLMLTCLPEKTCSDWLRLDF